MNSKSRKKMSRCFLPLIMVFLFIVVLGMGTVSADTDQTLSVSPAISTGDTSINPENNIEAVGILDNFNRPDGPIGANWTNQAGAFNVVSNAAQGGLAALATYNSATSTMLEGDISVNGTGLQYTGLVLSYADINNSLFLKVQQQNGGGTFDNAACYIGNNGSGGSFGLGFFTLDAPFATAHMEVALSGGTVTITFSNIDGGPGTQTYTCAGAPVTGGNGIGIAGYNSSASMDNFAAEIPGTMCIQDQYGNQYIFEIDHAHDYLYGSMISAQGCDAPIWHLTGSYNAGSGPPYELTAANPLGDADTACIATYKVKCKYPNGAWYYTWGYGAQEFIFTDCGAAPLVKNSGSGGTLR